MQWPYDHPRRGEMPPDYHALATQRIHRPQSALREGSQISARDVLRPGLERVDYSKNIVVDEKEHPYTGTKYAWVRARCVGGKTNIWGRLALRLSDYDFKAKSRDGYGEDWPISYADIEPYYDKRRSISGRFRPSKRISPTCRTALFQRPVKLNAAEIQLRGSARRRWAVC